MRVHHPSSVSDMLKPSEPSGSAFLKVDPTYIQHWQQLFPQNPVPVPVPRASLISVSSSSSTESPARSLSHALFDTGAASQAKELCLSSNFKNDKGSRLKLSSEELDYYLYGQQRMEIIPVNNSNGDANNREIRAQHTRGVAHALCEQHALRVRVS